MGLCGRTFGREDHDRQEGRVMDEIGIIYTVYEKDTVKFKGSLKATLIKDVTD